MAPLIAGISMWKTAVFGRGGIVYSLLAALNPSRTNPLDADPGTDLAQVATSPAYVPDKDGVIRIIGPGVVAIPGATPSWDTAQGATLGAELYTAANALGWADQNSTTDVTQSTGALVSAVSSPTDGSNFALLVESNTTPTSAARAYTGPFGTSGMFLEVTVRARHVGTGGNWRVGLATSTTLGSMYPGYAVVTPAQTTYQTYTFRTTVSTVRFFVIEDSTTNDGGLYIDNLSVKEVTPTWLDTGAYVTKTLLANGVSSYTGGGQGNPALGVMFAPSVTNKVTSHKAVPTVLTNVTKGGDAASTLTLATDATALTAAGLGNICTGNVFVLDNSAGVAVATATFGGTTGNTNKHTIAAYIRKSAGSGTSVMRLSSGAGATTITGSAYSRYAATNLTPANSSEQLVIEAGIGDVLHIILPHLTETTVDGSLIFASPETTAAVTRAARYLTMPGANLGVESKFTVTLNELGREQRLISDGVRMLWLTAANELSFTDGTTTITGASGFVVGTASEVRLDTTAGAWRILVNDVQIASGAGAAVTWGSTIYLGSSTTGTLVFNGYMSTPRSIPTVQGGTW